MTPDHSVAPRERVHFVYKPPTESLTEFVELPFKILVMGDYTRRPDERPLEERKPVPVDPDTFDHVLAAHGLALADLQALEASWRGLKYLVDHVDFRENIRVEVLAVSKEDLFEDFDESPGVTSSGLYHLVYRRPYDTFDGKPYGLLVGDYEFDNSPRDIALLRKIASVAAMAHAPFITGTAPTMFGLATWEGLPDLENLKGLFAEPGYAPWREFRASEEARYVGLCLPRVLFAQGVWGSAAFALAARIADSFAQYRWCPNILGPTGGVIAQGPTEVRLSERRAHELAEEGFIGPVFRADSPAACFLFASSCQQPRYFGTSKEGREAATHDYLCAQLPYAFVVNRLAHYLKVQARDQTGVWMERVDFERGLHAWLAQYVADMDDPRPSIRARRPLRAASVTVEDVTGQPGWWRLHLRVRPHFKYMGAYFTLSLVGMIDKR